MQDKLEMERLRLDALIQARNKEGLQSVEQMSKHPLSSHQKIEQRDRIDAQIKNGQNT